MNEFAHTFTYMHTVKYSWVAGATAARQSAKAATYHPGINGAVKKNPGWNPLKKDLPAIIWLKLTGNPVRVGRVSFNPATSYITSYDVVGSHGDCRKWMTLVEVRTPTEVGFEQQFVFIPVSKRQKFRCYGIRINSATSNIQLYLFKIWREAGKKLTLKIQMHKKFTASELVMFEGKRCIRPSIHESLADKKKDIVL